MTTYLLLLFGVAIIGVVAQYSVSLSVAGSSVQKTITRTGNHPNGYEVVLPAGKAGSLTLRTDNDTGEVTLSAGHGIVTGDKVDVYWSGGMRYGMTVGTVATNVVPIDLGAGSNLPTATTAVVVTKQVTINTSIDGDNVQIVGLTLELADLNAVTLGHIDMRDTGAATIASVNLVANVPLIYDFVAGMSNPFTGNPITVSKASNGSAVADAVLKVMSLENA